MGVDTKHPWPMPYPWEEIREKDGVWILGGDLKTETLHRGYELGIFPWPTEDAPMLTWHFPFRRAILEFKDVQIARSLKRFLRTHLYRLSSGEDFEGVIRACAEAPRPGQDGTWIRNEMIQAYCALFKAGAARSVEVWEGPNLVGGIYGVRSRHYFAGESMFFKRPNCSKLALLTLIEALKQEGLAWMDIQVMTPHMKAFGAKLISGQDFLKRIGATS